MSSDPYAEWDGAYVMGALSRAERQEYEAHLATCDACSRAVAELGPLPGLLGRLGPDDAKLLLTPAAEPPASIATPRVVPIPLWRRARVRIAAGVAAAAVIAAVVVPIAVHQGSAGPQPDETVALAAVRPGPLTASVSLTSVAWGTKVDMTCTYGADAGDAPGEEWPYRLYVVDAGGKATLVSSWHAGPGDTAHTTGSTDLSVDQIVQVQLRSASGKVLLSAAT